MEEREKIIESVIVVLDGLRISTNHKAVASLLWVFSNISLRPSDDLLVLVLLNRASPADQRSFQAEPDGYVNILRSQIAWRKDSYLEIFKPFYHRCKSIGVRFEVKVFAGSRSKMIVSSEATKSKATWVVMDRSLAEEESQLPIYSNDWKLVLVKDDVDAEILNANRIASATAEDESSHLSNANDPEQLPTDKGGRDLDPLELLKLPMEVSWEEIEAVTDVFRAGVCTQQEERVDMFKGFLRHPPGIPVLVKRFYNDFGGLIEAEKRVSMSMFHKNILSPIAYHVSSDVSALVYLYSGEGTLEHYLSASKRGMSSQLSCAERMRIAIGIGRGIRYMHEECSKGPVVHGNLRACKIFMGQDLQPLISGFEKATWLEQDFPVTKADSIRCNEEEASNSIDESMDMLKRDVLDFGVLLLRLFCRGPLPEDDVKLVKWAEPVLWQGAFHELLDLEMEELDPYETYRVMLAATHCTSTKPLSRPTMAQAVSILRGENSSALQSSPPLECSLGG